MLVPFTNRCMNKLQLQSVLHSIFKHHLTQEQSETTIQWINYNTLYPVLPETGPDALQINLWQTTFRVQRSNGDSLLHSKNPDVTKDCHCLINRHKLRSGYSTANQQRSILFRDLSLPNWTENGNDYEDIRFLSSNAMTQALLEDNMPPNSIDTVEAIFNPLGRWNWSYNNRLGWIILRRK